MYSAFDEKNSSKGRKFHFKYFFFLCVHKDNTLATAQWNKCNDELKTKLKPNERTERMKRGKKKWNEMKWPNMYNKQWKIHNEFEKDECKWSEVDFYQEFLLCIYTCNVQCFGCAFRYPHMCIRGIKCTFEVEKRCQSKKNHQHQQQQQQTESKTWKKITIRTKRSKQSTKCAILSGIWVFENDMFVHIAYTLHAFSFDTSLCAYKQEWQLIYNALKPNHALFRTKVLMVIAKNQNIINGEWAAESGWRRKKEKKTYAAGQFPLNSNAYQMSPRNLNLHSSWLSTLNFKYQDA